MEHVSHVPEHVFSPTPTLPNTYEMPISYPETETSINGKTPLCTMDVDFARGHFPALAEPVIYMDNAGGAQVLRSVADRLSEFLLGSNVQLGASYGKSQLAAQRVQKGVHVVADLMNASPEEAAIAFLTF